MHIPKPDFIVRKRASGHGAAEYFIDAIKAQVAVAVGILSGKTVIHVEVWTTDERDHVTICIFITLHILIAPLRSQGFSVATTRIRGKAINLRDDLLHTSVLQVRDELIKLPDVLFGDKQVAAGFHSDLSGQLDRTQALSVRTLAHHGPIMNLVSPVESKPEGGGIQFAQGFENFAPVWPGRQGNPGGRKWLKIVMPDISEEAQDLYSLRMGVHLVHGKASIGEVMCFAETTHFI